MNVLITGATGYFGHGFVKHLLDNNLAERICIFSRGEFAQHTMRQKFNDDERLRWFIGDVRDQDRLRRAMDGCDTVVHAAALKRIEVAEYNALECIATNVHGTENVVKAAIDAGVRVAVLLSTDKACEPVTTYGLSKAMAEQIFHSAINYAPLHHITDPVRNFETEVWRTDFRVCRYGNVAGSTGSIIPTWRKLLETQDWVPVYDPTATRFWMHRDEAIELVMQAIRKDAKQHDPIANTWIPTLKAYEVKDLALAMGARGRITTPRGQEKKHEAMRAGDTSDMAKRMTVEQLREALKNVE